jgi:hypothetical protein
MYPRGAAVTARGSQNGKLGQRPFLLACCVFRCFGLRTSELGVVLPHELVLAFAFAFALGFWPLNTPPRDRCPLLGVGG